MGYYDVDKSAANAPNTQTVAQPGYNASPEYVVSALPWVTTSVLTSGSTFEYKLPYVAKYIKVINNGSSGDYIRLGFTKNGVEGNGSSNYVLINGTKDITFDNRVSVFYIRSHTAASPICSLSVGLTAIPSKFAPVLSGSTTGNGSWEGVG